jgi:hypothetical protein
LDYCRIDATGGAIAAGLATETHQPMMTVQSKPVLHGPQRYGMLFSQGRQSHTLFEMRAQEVKTL